MTYTSATESFVYTGKVDVDIQLSNGKIVHLHTHNKGLPYISLFFAQTMIGYDRRAYIPNKCKIEQYQDGSWVTITKSSGIPLTSKTYTKIDDNIDSMYEINYNILITYNYINASAARFTSGDRCRLVLQNSNSDEFAVVELVTDDTTIPIQSLVSETQNGIVNWRLSLCNPVTNNDTILNLSNN